MSLNASMWQLGADFRSPSIPALDIISSFKGLTTDLNSTRDMIKAVRGLSIAPPRNSWRDFHEIVQGAVKTLASPSLDYSKMIAEHASPFSKIIAAQTAPLSKIIAAQTAPFSKIVESLRRSNAEMADSMRAIRGSILDVSRLSRVLAGFQAPPSFYAPSSDPEMREAQRIADGHRPTTGRWLELLDRELRAVPGYRGLSEGHKSQIRNALLETVRRNCRQYIASRSATQYGVMSSLGFLWTFGPTQIRRALPRWVEQQARPAIEAQTGTAIKKLVARLERCGLNGARDFVQAACLELLGKEKHPLDEPGLLWLRSCSRARDESRRVKRQATGSGRDLSLTIDSRALGPAAQISVNEAIALVRATDLESAGAAEGLARRLLGQEFELGQRVVARTLFGMRPLQAIAKATPERQREIAHQLWASGYSRTAIRKALGVGMRVVDRLLDQA